MKLTKSKLKQLVENELNSALLKEANVSMGQTLQNKVVALERRVAKLEQQARRDTDGEEHLLRTGNFDHDTGLQHKSEKWNKEGPLDADMLNNLKKMSRNFGKGATTRQQRDFAKQFGFDFDLGQFGLSESNDD